MEKEIKNQLVTPVRFRVAKPRLSCPDIEELHVVFNLFTLEGTDLLDMSELKDAMKSLGFEKKDKRIYEMIVELEAKQRGKVMSFEEFLEELVPSVRNLESKEESDKIFKLYTDGTVITAEDIKKAAKELDEEFTDKEIQTIISNINKGRPITKDDFHRIIKSKVFP